ncbi:hypothetical protein CPB84DRAFT_1849943 [Gymnopilus junonius]|uniref:Nibrin n=1 Tax=Gymnopilus junonius TaxID=109634 RepID=A0A9P5TJ50_GYMJU|nr:hypothetical protein CPB84DRAFT_1849943 [Gymnopilus junonius]
MWVVVGPFDGEVVGDISFQKAKLLKPNTVYALGRKDKPLVVNSKKISHDHLELIVGPHSADDARDPNKKPTLELLFGYKQNKSITLRKKDDSSATVYPDCVRSLAAALTLVLTEVMQHQMDARLCLCLPTVKPPISIDVCAALGIKLVHTLQDNITHHLASHYVANLQMAASLLALSHIVKPEWLLEVLRLGNLPRNNEQSNGTSLEDHFILPLETKYRPSFSPSLLPSQKPLISGNPMRKDELREAIHRGGGILEMFDIHSGVPKFRKALTRSHAKEGKQTVVVGDVDAMQTAIGREDWAQIISEARGFGLDILSPSKVVQSVLEVNLLLLKSDRTSTDQTPSSPLPQVIPNSIPEEQTVEPEPEPEPPAAPPRRRLVRRATSREPSAPPTTASTSDSASTPAPEGESGGEPSVKPRRILTRRFATALPPLVTTGSEDGSQTGTTPPPSTVTRTVWSNTRTETKRRVGVPGGVDSLASATDAIQTALEETFGEEPPLKKFKALFDATDPDNAGSSGGVAGPLGTATADEFEMIDSLAPFTHSQSQTQTQTQIGGTGAMRRNLATSNLAVLREEEEEGTQSTVPPRSAGGRVAKRRLEAVDEDESEVVGWRAVENVNAIDRTTEATQQKDKAPGAQPGKPDTDAAFLKALASTKRGKKAEDQFDREFNKLKISKPTGVDDEREARREREEEEWAVLAEFGDDSGMRGNFMVVLEMEVYKKGGEGEEGVMRKAVGNRNPAWDGKPNFKKFKKKIVGVPRAKVELFIDDNDYGMGSAYWKGGSSQTQMRNAFKENQMESQSQSQGLDQFDFEESKKPRSRQQRPAASTADSDDQPMASQVPKSRKPPSKAESSQRGTARSQRSGAGKAQSQSTSKQNQLFLDTDEDEDEDNFQGFGGVDDSQQPRRTNVQPLVEDEDEEVEETLRSSAGIGPTATKEKAKAPTSKSKTTTKAPTAPATGKRSTRRATTKTLAAAKKAEPIIVDDDSDDGVFRGFRGR